MINETKKIKKEINKIELKLSVSNICLLFKFPDSSKLKIAYK